MGGGGDSGLRACCGDKRPIAASRSARSSAASPGGGCTAAACPCSSVSMPVAPPAAASAASATRRASLRAQDKGQGGSMGAGCRQGRHRRHRRHAAAGSVNDTRVGAAEQLTGGAGGAHATLRARWLGSPAQTRLRLHVLARQEWLAVADTRVRQQALAIKKKNSSGRPMAAAAAAGVAVWRQGGGAPSSISSGSSTKPWPASPSTSDASDLQECVCGVVWGGGPGGAGMDTEGKFGVGWGVTGSPPGRPASRPPT